MSSSSGEEQDPALTAKMTDDNSRANFVPSTPAMGYTPGMASPSPYTPGGGSVMATPAPMMTPGRSPAVRFESTPHAGGVGASAMLSPANEPLQRVIWGTDANVDECFEALTDFLRNFDGEAAGAPEDAAARGGSPLYTRMLRRLHELDENVLDVDLRHLQAFNERIFSLLIHYPTEVIGIFDLALQEVYNELFGDLDGQARRRRLEIRVFGLSEEQLCSLRELDPTLINQIVGVRGMVIRCSQVLPDLYQGMYRCTQCFHMEEVDVDRGRLVEPTRCVHCGGKGTFELLHNRGRYNDKQLIRLQEAPEQIPQGETPATVTVVAYDSLVDAVKPGDRVELVGIFRAVPTRVNPKQRVVSNIFRTYIDLVHVRPASAAETAHDADAVAAGLEAAAVREQRMRAIAQLDGGDAYELLARSISPSIYGMEDVKKGVLLQLLGGSGKGKGVGAGADDSSARQDNSVGGSDGGGIGKGESRLRSEVNVLLVGDPGTSKSQMLKAVHRLAPRGIYTSGNGSSAVGLTAYVTRDGDTGELVLESGALVLSDRGVCCVDEFDKMNDFTRSVLHEAMEQQTISIAKAGIIATLNARTSLLAAANPVHSRYNPKLTVVDNIQLPPTLLSRFDLIFLILDHPSVEEDRRLARHIVSMFYPGAASASGRPRAAPSMAPTATLEPRRLTEFIAYARQSIQPRLTDAAVERLVQLYVALRRRGSESSGTSGGGGGVRTVTATPRNLESMIRLAEARAKARLSHEVLVSDVDEAHRLMMAAIAQVATDPSTGLLDIDLLNAGQSSAARGRVRELAATVWRTLGEMSSGDVRTATLHERVMAASGGSVGEADFKQALRSLQDEEKLIFVQGGQAVRRLL